MKIIRNSLLLGLLCVALGFGLLCLVYSIPASLMQDECYESLPAFSEDGIVDNDPLSGHKQDNFSDAVRLLEAACPEQGNLLERVIGCYFMATPALPGMEFEKPEGLLFFEEEPLNPVKSFRDLYGYETQGRPICYSRYWHGYLIYLKPLLAVFNYNQIRLISAGAQTLLLLALLALLVKKLPRAAAPFALTVLLLAPGSVGRCLQFSDVYTIMLIASLLLLWNPGGRLNRDNLPYFFLLVGIATVFFDLMSAPSITLTLPLCLLLAQERRGGDEKALLRTVAWCALLWLLGYGGMWAAKWLIAWLRQGEPFFNSLFGTVSTRASSDVGSGEAVSRVGTLLRNVRELFSVGWVNALVLAYAAGAALAGLFGKKRGLRFDGSAALRLLIPTALALVWVLALCNHSYIHFWFAFRTLTPCVLALLLALTPVKEERKPFAEL